MDVTIRVPGWNNLSVRFDASNPSMLGIVSEAVSAFSAIANTQLGRDWDARLGAYGSAGVAFDILPPTLTSTAGGGGNASQRWVQAPNPFELYLGQQNGQFVFSQYRKGDTHFPALPLEARDGAARFR